PNEALQAFAAVHAGTVGRDTTAIASGEPAGFAADLLAGLDALAHLADGRAAYDGSRWVLTGTAASQRQGEAAVAALTTGSRQGALWTSAIAGYQPPAPVAEEPPGSSEPPPSSQPSSEQLPAEPAVSSEPPPEPSSEPAAEPFTS